MAKQYAITTFDNPWNPFTHFDEWLAFDNEHEYNTLNKLSRIANLSSDLTDEEEKIETEKAIDVMIENDFLNIYRKKEME